MGKSDYSIESTVRSDGTVVQERVIAFMRARYPVWTAKRVAADTGISPGTIIKWLDRGSAPSAAHMWRLGCAYGLSFLAAIYVEVDAVEAARLADEVAALEARVAALKQRGSL